MRHWASMSCTAAALPSSCSACSNRAAAAATWPSAASSAPRSASCAAPAVSPGAAPVLAAAAAAVSAAACGAAPAPAAWMLPCMPGCPCVSCHRPAGTGQIPVPAAQSQIPAAAAAAAAAGRLLLLLLPAAAAPAPAAAAPAPAAAGAAGRGWGRSRGLRPPRPAQPALAAAPPGVAPPPAAASPPAALRAPAAGGEGAKIRKKPWSKGTAGPCPCRPARSTGRRRAACACLWRQPLLLLVGEGDEVRDVDERVFQLLRELIHVGARRRQRACTSAGAGGWVGACGRVLEGDWWWRLGAGTVQGRATAQLRCHACGVAARREQPRPAVAVGWCCSPCCCGCCCWGWPNWLLGGMALKNCWNCGQRARGAGAQDRGMVEA